MIALDKESVIPLYYQLKTWLSELIDNGDLRPGDQAPTEQELCQKFGLSRGTVRRALAELVHEKKLYLVRGRGTYIAEPEWPPWTIATAVSVTEALKEQNLFFETRILEQHLIKADPHIATRLNIEPGGTVVFLKRLRLVEGTPLVLFISYLPLKIMPGLHKLNLTDCSLYQTLEEKYGLHIEIMDRTIYSRLATVAEAELLRIPNPSPLLVFEDVAYDIHNRTLDYGYDLYQGSEINRFAFKVDRQHRYL